MKPGKRKVDLVIISDVHLGTYGCHAQELLHYLKSIEPGHIVLNGDIIDMWQFSKRYWPKSHMKVIRYLMDALGKGIPITYITGNHDEMLRKFEGLNLGSLRIVNKLLLPLQGGPAWIFHGDVFDVTMQHSRWLARLGSVGYDLLILINRFVNRLLQAAGRGRISLSKRVKNSVKSAVNFISSFESLVTDLARENGYRYVICGHIHHPTITHYGEASARVTYLNSGDWVENLTALEYHRGSWSLFKYAESALAGLSPVDAEVEDLSSKALFEHLLLEFNISRS